MVNIIYIILGIIILMSAAWVFVPTKWYQKSRVNWRMLGAWLFIFATGLIMLNWVIEVMVLICKFIWMIFCIICWGSIE